MNLTFLLILMVTTEAMAQQVYWTCEVQCQRTRHASFETGKLGPAPRPQRNPRVASSGPLKFKMPLDADKNARKVTVSLLNGRQKKVGSKTIDIDDESPPCSATAGSLRETFDHLSSQIGSIDPKCTGCSLTDVEQSAECYNSKTFPLKRLGPAQIRASLKEQTEAPTAPAATAN